ncbi:hypothetical protein CHU95_15675 [Niveispirillum lacus]|uniref:IrrE N-terminal-like domain-containing protein n=1 Tax=Niveispirillum lacus TaxID=1981099 RepID=A0A255YX33_9PROT|nr:ImmA/IrrE family metallo-endopeptidase [Niveispirillum lacus]OYQ33772.1 hypothetical protein CHU95_15675 [Niveispirillum lacus]
MIRQRHKLDDLLTAKMGGRDAYDAMRRACDELLAQAGPIRLPIKLAPLARLMGAELNYDNSNIVGREEAAIYFRSGKLILWVSRDRFQNMRTQKRARFSIAHELGHLLLFRMLGPEFLDHSENDSQSYALTERLCDFAASQILMPRTVLLDAAKERFFTEDGLKYLEELFAVSSPALLRALADLLPSGAVLELRKFSRHRREHMLWRVQSCMLAASAEDFTSWLPNGCTLKHLQGMPSPEELPNGCPVPLGLITLIRGRSRISREAIATRTEYRLKRHPELLPPIQSPLASTQIMEDESAGRVLVLIGKPGTLNTIWPLAETLE